MKVRSTVNTGMVDRFAAIERIIGGRDPQGAIMAYRLYVCDELSMARVVARLGITRRAVHKRVARVRDAMDSIGVKPHEVVEIIAAHTA